MKKIATVLISLSVLLVGCQKNESTQASDSAENADSQSVSDQNDSTSTENVAVDSSKETAADAQSSKKADTEPVDITFDDIKLPIQEDIVFRPFMLTDRAKELDGQRVRLSGFMLADAKIRGIEQFVLLKNTECKFGPGGQADHLVNVIMTDGQSTFFRNDAVSVEGVIKVNPFNGVDGNTWSIYDLTCERVEKHRSRR